MAEESHCISVLALTLHLLITYSEKFDSGHDPSGSSSTVAELIKGGADVNVNAAGVTALHTAAECGSMDTVKALLQV